MRIWRIFLFLRAVVNIPIQTLIIPPWLLLRKMIISQLELGPLVVLVLITKLEHPCAEFLCLFCKHKFIGLIIKQGHSSGEGGCGIAIHLKKNYPVYSKFPSKSSKIPKFGKKSILHAHLLLAKNTVYPV